MSHNSLLAYVDIKKLYLYIHGQQALSCWDSQLFLVSITEECARCEDRSRRASICYESDVGNLEELTNQYRIICPRYPKVIIETLTVYL